MVSAVIRPVPDELTAPFWDAARRCRLAIQRCRACTRFNHPPQILCGWCSSTELGYQEVPGDGQIYSYTTFSPRRRDPGDPEPEPYTNLVVQLDVQEGIYLVGRVPGGVPAWATIGARVELFFEVVAEGELVLPQFKPIGTG